MWSAARRVLLGVGALLGVLVYSLQFKKACEEATPSQCVMSLIQWAGHGQLTPRRDVASAPAKGQPPAPEAPKAVASDNTKPPPAPPAALVSSSPPSAKDETSSVKIPAHVERAQARRGRPLTVVNSGDEELLYFYATGCSDRNWGRDLLGKEEVIKSGASRNFELDDASGNCCFDLRAKFQRGETRSNMGVDICRIGSWTVSNRP